MVCPNIVFEISSAGLVSWASVWDPIVILRGLGLGITSREVVGLFLEQFWTNFAPVFHCLQGRFTADV